MKDGDKKLLEKLRKGERGAFREFYKETSGWVLGMAMKKTAVKKDAEEVMQDVYLAFLDSLPLFKGDSSLKTFLGSILRHELADYWRKKYAKKAIRTVPFVNQVYTEKLYPAKKTALVIEAVYARLKPWEVRVLRCKYEEGWSVRRIASEMGWSVRAAESRLFRARKAFQLVYNQL